MSASFISYGVIAEVIALVFFGIALIRSQRRLPLVIMTGLSALLLATQLAWIVPLFRSEDRPATSQRFTVATLNMHNGQANVDQVATRTKHADIVVLVEVTHKAAKKVRTRLSSRLSHQLPSHVRRPRGVLILSRFRLSHPQHLPSRTSGLAVKAKVPGTGSVNVVAGHPCNPLCGGGAWMRDNHAILKTARALKDRPTVIAGDLNSVHDHKTMRDFAAHGYQSATKVAGAGWIPTYPANSLLPPLLPIDHVLINRQLTAIAVHAFDVAGTDHRGVIARVAAS